MRKKLLIVALIGLFSLVAGGWSFLLAEGKSQRAGMSLSENEFIRFHVIANSDSPFDQAVKLKVRDKVLDYLSPKLQQISSPSEAREVIAKNRQTVIGIADQILAENGAGYRADLEIGVYDFPVKVYGSLIVPAGKYEAVRITLGQAQGKNWWCVLFPPLCFIDINSTIAAQPVTASSQLTEGEQRQPKIEFKWKLAELLHRQ